MALINRDRMPTPKAVKKQNVDTGDSKILQDHDNTNDLKHVLGIFIKFGFYFLFTKQSDVHN